MTLAVTRAILATCVPTLALTLVILGLIPAILATCARTCVRTCGGLLRRRLDRGTTTVGRTTTGRLREACTSRRAWTGAGAGLLRVLPLVTTGMTGVLVLVQVQALLLPGRLVAPLPGNTMVRRAAMFPASPAFQA